MKKLYVLVFAIFGLFACSNNDESLELSNWVSDKADYNLPMYSELGYNTFGAKYNRMYFVSSYDEEPCQLFCENGKIKFLMQGRLGHNGGTYLYSDISMKMFIIFKGDTITSYTDVASLEGKIIDLSDTSNVLIVTEQRYRDDSDVTIDTLRNIENGKLEFSKIKNLYVDDELFESTISGRFNLLAYPENKENLRISDGRFDFGINERNFRFIK